MYKIDDLELGEIAKGYNGNFAIVKSNEGGVKYYAHIEADDFDEALQVWEVSDLDTDYLNAQGVEDIADTAKDVNIVEQEMSVSGYFNVVCPYCGKINSTRSEEVRAGRKKHIITVCKKDKNSGKFGCGKHYAVRVSFVVTSTMETATFKSLDK